MANKKDEITVEEMVEWLEKKLDANAWMQITHPHLVKPHTDADRDMFQAIREALMGQPTQVLMTKEEYEKSLERPTVSREWIEIKVDERHKQHDERGYFDPMLREIRIKDFIETLTELGIKVID